MADNDTIQRSDDGRVAPSTPAAASSQATPPQASPQHQADSARDTAASPAAPNADAVMDREFDRLKAEHDQKNARTRNAASSPSSDGSPAAQGSGPSPASPATKTPAGDAATEADPRQAITPAEYNGTIDEDSLTALKRVGMVIPPGAWAEMSVEDRAMNVRAAKQIRADKDRAFQAQQQQAGQGPSSLYAPQHQQQPQQQQSVQQPVGQGQGFQTPQAGQGPAAPVQLPPEVLAHVEWAKANVGDEYAERLLQSETRRQHQFEALASGVRQSQQALHEERQRYAASVHHEHRQRVMSAESSVIEKLAAKFPKLKDPAVAAKVVENARSWSMAMEGQGRRYDSVEKDIEASVAFAYQAEFFPEIQKDAQLALAQGRERTLSGSVERGTNTSRPARPLTNAEKEDAIYDRLKALDAQGKSGQQARELATAGLR